MLIDRDYSAYPKILSGLDARHNQTEGVTITSLPQGKYILPVLIEEI
jgi:hypothetical protein